MKYLKKYLIVTSVILHVAIVLSLIWVVPFLTHSMEVGKSWSELSKKGEIGVVENVSEIVRGNLKYKGYLVNYKGQNLYVMGTGTDEIKKGDVVNVMVSEHPYSPLKTLMVVITKKSP